jgi:hypothetical protein
MPLGVQKSVREWTLTLPRELPLWEVESQWTPEFLESDFKGQNPLDWCVPYIIGKLLERRCLKWVRMTHLDTWNTSYAQKKGRESNWQFDSRALKVENRPNFLVCRWCATYRWKALNEVALDFIFNWRFLKKVMGPKSRENPKFENFRDSHLGVPRQNAI